MKYGCMDVLKYVARVSDSRKYGKMSVVLQSSRGLFTVSPHMAVRVESPMFACHDANEPRPVLIVKAKKGFQIVPNASLEPDEERLAKHSLVNRLTDGKDVFDGDYRLVSRCFIPKELEPLAGGKRCIGLSVPTKTNLHWSLSEGDELIDVRFLPVELEDVKWDFARHANTWRLTALLPDCKIDIYIAPVICEKNPAAPEFP